MPAFTPYTIGAFDSEAIGDFRQFELHWHTDLLQLTWNHSDLSAKFFSHYFASAFPLKDNEAEGFVAREEMTYSINYLMNELMENAVKFHSGHQVSLSGGIQANEIGFLVSNEIAADNVRPFATILEEITSEDPGLLLLQKIEQNAENAESSGSGLGFLTLMSDYQARLGWLFEPSTQPDQIRVTTMARLNLKISAA